MTEPKEILNIDEAAKLLGVSVKTFNKVLHAQSLPGRKIGREWKFSRQALIDWVGSGRSLDFYRESDRNGGASSHADDSTLTPQGPTTQSSARRRTSGWRIELD